MICGQGFGNFAIWDVSLNYLPSEGASIGQYSDTWEVIGTGSFGSPAMLYGFFARPMAFDSTGIISGKASTSVEAVLLGTATSTLKAFSFIEEHAPRPNALADGITMGLNFTEESLDESANSSMSQIHREDKVVYKIGKGKKLSDDPMLHVYCTSSDGTILFGGLNDLIVYT